MGIEMRWIACFLCLLTLAPACVLEDKPIDGGGGGGGDGGTCGDCPDEKPVCNSDMQCVECNADDHDYCSENGLVCDTRSFTCVTCVASSDCNDPNAAHCNTDENECDGCESQADCIGIEDLPICDNGVCVACTPATEELDCPGTSCDPRTRTCTDTTLASRETCQTCVSDSDCKEAGNRCVAMTYQGVAYPDAYTGFCLKTFSVGDPCQQPYFVPLRGRESLSGPPTANYCGINEEMVTCDAVYALLNNVECPSGNDSACPEGGLCRDFADGLAEDRCTYACDLPAQCPSGEPANTCGSSGSGGGKFCGG